MKIPYEIHQLVDEDRISKERIQEWEELAFPRYWLIPKWICRRYINWMVERKYKRYLRELNEIKKILTEGVYKDGDTHTFITRTW